MAPEGRAVKSQPLTATTENNFVLRGRKRPQPQMDRGLPSDAKAEQWLISYPRSCLLLADGSSRSRSSRTCRPSSARQLRMRQYTAGLLRPQNCPGCAIAATASDSRNRSGRRCRALSAAAICTAQAQALAIELRRPRWHSLGLASIIRRVQPAAARASLRPCSPGQIMVEHDQQLMEPNVVDKLLVQPTRVHLYLPIRT